MTSTTNKNGGQRQVGLGFCGALGVLFIGLKLAGIIDWSWLWVTAPLWVGFAISFVFLILYVVCLWLGNRKR